METEKLSDLTRRLSEMDTLLGETRRILSAQYRRKRLAVFLPWRAETWDAMESVWKAAMEDPEYEVAVVPLPWYYRDAMGAPKEDAVQYAPEAFPEYVPVTDYRSYPLPRLRPDLILIQNPYDVCNYTTMVDPRFWSNRLKGYTEHLVYLPWFVTDEIDAVNEPDDPAVYNMRYYVTVPGVVHSDLVIVQSELMRESYIKVLTEMSGEELRDVWEEKIRAFGSPLMEERGGGKDLASVSASPIWDKLKQELQAREERQGGDRHGNI